MLTPAITFTFGIVLLLLFGWYFTTDSERAKRMLGTALTVLGTALAVFSFLPPFDVPQKDASGAVVKDKNGNVVLAQEGRIHLGIDLKGGTSFLLRLKPAEDNPKPITKDSLDRAMEVIRRRVDSGGVSEPVIAPAPPDRVMVQLPGVDPGRVEYYREALKKVAKLEFRMVHLESESLIAQREANPASFIDPAYEIVDYLHTRDGKEVREKMLVSKKVEITGERVKDSYVRIGQTGGWDIHLEFDSEGGKLFADVTGRMAANKQHRERFAILMDKVVISAAGLSEGAMAAGGLKDGSAVITGDFEEKEARNVASSLLNPLENPVVIEEERSTSATLGGDAIASGILAGYIGAGITLIVTLLYYRFAGLIANLALLIFVLLLFGAMAMFGAVLTLPGIAGILLTLGMAIDANVLIYERLREEQAAGKSLGVALEAAYNKAFSAIFDSNVTTLITAGLLFWKATGPVKGFAVSLIIGVIASMFTALIVTRNLFAWGMHWGLIKRITMVNLIPVTKIDFMGKRKIATIISVAVMLGSVGIFAARGEKNFGVDFNGGDRLVMKAEAAKPTLDAMRQSLEAVGFADSVVQLENSSQGEFIVVRDKQGSAPKISETLIAKFPESKLTEVNRETVGAVVGKQLATNSLVALGLGMIGILIYVTIRFEFSFAIGALIALLHDVIITVGVFSLLGRELSLVIVGAVLTVAGYSVNDTIVVYDRIREGIKAGRSGSITHIMNASINETLSRTILTGGVTLLTTGALFFFGGPVLNDFALTILIGILVGTYSSVFIAAPVVLWWSGRGGRDLKSEIKRGDEEAVVPT